MSMIDVYARTGTFTEPHSLTRELAATIMSVEQVPDIARFRQCRR